MDVEIMCIYRSDSCGMAYQNGDSEVEGMIYDFRKNNSLSMVSNILLITYASHTDIFL
jgi:hypothetical protein